MKNYEDSFYAKNKYSPNIVYICDNGTYIEITVEIYLKENPTHTVEDFQRFKELSDNIYRIQDRKENAQTKKNMPIHKYEEAIECAIPSTEELYLMEEDKRKIWDVLLSLVKSKEITKKQLMRFLSFALDEKKVTDIAKEENVHWTAVSKSIKKVRCRFRKRYHEIK